MQRRKATAENISKGLRHSARRCQDEGGATLGVVNQMGGTVMQPRWG
ncbi:MAG TPA: hypothetical protein VFA77_16565 [Candidatus Eisenbacteria bacterium]|nr:hypothetical protein [Candidatus Eisenbacteria bacterium]